MGFDWLFKAVSFHVVGFLCYIQYWPGNEKHGVRAQEKWQSCVPIFLTKLIFNAARLSSTVNLRSHQPISGCSCPLLIASLKLRFVKTYWCMALKQLWAQTALTALTAWCFSSLCVSFPVVISVFFFSLGSLPIFQLHINLCSGQRSQITSPA